MRKKKPCSAYLLDAANREIQDLVAPTQSELHIHCHSRLDSELDIYSLSPHDWHLSPISRSACDLGFSGGNVSHSLSATSFTHCHTIDMAACPTFEEIPPYRFKPLDSRAQQIRLVELLPGGFDDVISLHIHHVTLPLNPVNDQEQPIPNPSELQSTLAPGWIVQKTIFGRLLFEYNGGSGQPSETSWLHPLTGLAYPEDVAHRPMPRLAYEALSHVWGPAEHYTTVHVGPSANSPDRQHVHVTAALQIRTELAVALRHLRYRESSRLLWIDMLCINQEDASERSRQVRQMGYVYEAAHKVIVWLGEAVNNSKQAVEVLNYLGRQVEYTQDGAWRVNAPGCDKPLWALSDDPLPYDETTWKAIKYLVERPWFQRVWVWQEAKLGSKESSIQCGHDTIPLSVFGQAAWLAAAKCDSQLPDVQSLLHNAGDVTLPQLEGPFAFNLYHLHYKQCLDPRDKIYGTLGLAPNQITNRIIPDYTRSVGEVYKEAAVELYADSSRLDLLVKCDLESRRIDCPSWVPDWSVPTRREGRYFQSSSQASGCSVSTVKGLNDRTTVLECRGLKCGVINSVSRQTSNGPEALDDVLTRWLPDSLETETYVTGEPLLDAFIKTILCHQLVERYPTETSFPTLSSAKSQLRCIIEHYRHGPPIDLEEDIALCLPEIRGRRYLTTDTGYIGMTSASAKARDILCVILGCPCPVILRPDHRHDFVAYRVVGIAYIQGLMDAEALLGPLPEDYIVQIGAQNDWYGTFQYHNRSTGETTNEDPRLGDLPSGWEKLEARRESTDPLHFVKYRHLRTKNTINGDPRLLPEMLRQRGVDVQTFALV